MECFLYKHPLVHHCGRQDDLHLSAPAQFSRVLLRPTPRRLRSIRSDAIVLHSHWSGFHLILLCSLSSESLFSKYVQQRFTCKSKASWLFVFSTRDLTQTETCGWISSEKSLFLKKPQIWFEAMVREHDTGRGEMLRNCELNWD